MCLFLFSARFFASFETTCRVQALANAHTLFEADMPRREASREKRSLRNVADAVDIALGWRRTRWLGWRRTRRGDEEIGWQAFAMSGVGAAGGGRMTNIFSSVKSLF